MNDGLKQRIIGALVLVALGVIFIPVVFDKGRIEPVDRNTQIPPEPDILALPLPEGPVAPRPKDERLIGPATGQFEIEDKDNVEAEISSADALDSSADIQAREPTIETDPESGLAQAWVLQVASYSSDESANTLRDELLALGYKAFKRSFETQSGTRVRVFVGPNIDKAALESAQRILDQRYKVNSMLLRYKR